jgi:hypothetical protein
VVTYDDGSPLDTNIFTVKESIATDESVETHFYINAVATTRDKLGQYKLRVTEYDTFYDNNEVSTDIVINVTDLCDSAKVSSTSVLKDIQV